MGVIEYWNVNCQADTLFTSLRMLSHNTLLCKVKPGFFIVDSKSVRVRVLRVVGNEPKSSAPE